MSLAIQFIVILACCAAINAEDLYVGNSANTTLAYSEDVKLSAILGFRREKNVFYNTNNSTKIIKAIAAIDLDKTTARSTITAGGVGSTYVNVRMKSERGDGLNYLVQIYI